MHQVTARPRGIRATRAPSTRGRTSTVVEVVLNPELLTGGSALTSADSMRTSRSSAREADRGCRAARAGPVGRQRDRRAHAVAQAAVRESDGILIVAKRGGTPEDIAVRTDHSVRDTADDGQTWTMAHRPRRSWGATSRTAWVKGALLVPSSKRMSMRGSDHAGPQSHAE
jgi:hypothetical protein